MKIATTQTFIPLPDRMRVLDLVRPGLFRKDPEMLTVLDNFDVSYPSLEKAIEGARRLAKPRTADIAVIKSGATFGLQNLVESYGPGMTEPFDKAYSLRNLQDRDYFRYLHPDLQALVGIDHLVTREQLVARLRVPGKS